MLLSLEFKLASKTGQGHIDAIFVIFGPTIQHGNCDSKHFLYLLTSILIQVLIHPGVESNARRV